MYQQYRMAMNHFCFKAELKNYVQLDTAKPLFIPAGSDSFESIGIPPGISRTEFETKTPANRVAKWRDAVEAYFPVPVDGECKIVHSARMY